MKIPQSKSPLANVVKGAAALAAGVTLAIANPTSASADSGHWIYVTGGKAMFSGSNITVCDTAVDGNRVRAQLMSNTSTIYFTGWAPSQGCITEGHPTSIVQFRVCTENIGCSAWHNRY